MFRKPWIGYLAQGVVGGAFAAMALGQVFAAESPWHCPPGYDYYHGVQPHMTPRPASPLGEALPQDAAGQAPQAFDQQPGAQDQQPFDASLSSATGAAASPGSVAPNMVGDLFGGGGQFGSSLNGFLTVPIAGGDRNYKIAENTNPFPQDRVFFNFNHFSDALIVGSGSDLREINVDRYVFGAEKTFLDGMMSAEIRLPFASGLAADQPISRDAEGTEFGNIALNFKALLWQGYASAVSGGVGMTLPTADDVVFDGFPTTRIENTSYHLLPFLGWHWRPTCSTFVNAYCQVDFDATGYDVYEDGYLAGVYQEQTLLYLDLQIGWWMHRNPCGFITGVAPILEWHYTTSLQDTDSVTIDVDTLENRLNQFHVLNLTAGLIIEMRQMSTLSVACVAPLHRDRLSSPIGPVDFPSWEMAVQFNRRF